MNNIEVGKVVRLAFTGPSESAKVATKTYTQDVLVTAVDADGAVTGHRIVKKTGLPEKGIGTWTAYDR